MFTVKNKTNLSPLLPSFPQMTIYTGDLNSGAEAAAYDLYSLILNNHEPSKICRIWNFVPNIHINDHGDERYRQFCFGRYRAFKKFNVANMNFPAATGIGSFDDTLRVGILTTSEPISHFNNELQVNPFEYPKQYGRVGPSFSRATITDSLLFVSGTASIRGHITLYSGDIEKQTLTTLENIEYLVLKANKLSKQKFKVSQALWRVYLRNPENKELVENKLISRWNSKDIEFCHAEICRKDLLVEIEGVCFAAV